eukprot:XP_003731648.1 PREDICTED: prothymosin alpha-B [Strongylocentrotus purpuratus]
MPSDKYRQKNPRNKQTKFRLEFDETSRNDFLTGFRKRKNARKKIALQEADEKRREGRRQERQQRREALEEELSNIRLPEPATESQKEDVVIDHPEHTVTVTTTLDLQKEHGGIGENQVDYNEEEEEEEGKEEFINGEELDDEDEDDDNAGIRRHTQDDDEEEEEASEDEETIKMKAEKNKKK